MNRGVCSPGLRQQVDAVTGDLACVRKRSWPDAYLAEIGEPGASTDHERHCGKWIDAGSIAYGDQKWAFYDAEDVERDVDNLVRAKGASRMATTDLGKFRASCRSMVASNSQGASAKQAYDLLFPIAERRLAGHGARERRVPRVALLRHARARGRRARRQPSPPRC